MSAFTWPRTILPAKSSLLNFPGALTSVGQTGKMQTRATGQVGATWTEVYGPFDPRSVDGKRLISRIRQAWRGGLSFTIDHLVHATHAGGGSGAPTVNGAGQVGNSLVTANWTGTNPVLRAGDIIRVPGVPYALELTDDAPNLSGGGTTLAINPPLFAGTSPTNGGAVAYSGITLIARLAEEPDLSAAEDGAFLVDGLTLVFREAL